VTARATSRPRVAVLGSTGAVGRAVVATLSDSVRLRLGGRRADALEAQAARLPDAETALVDVADDASLERLAAGCAVVVNCAGPSYVVLDRVAKAALAAGCDYVDPGGDEPVMSRLDRAAIAAAGRRVVLVAGVMPGLSSLLPRWLATSLPGPPRRLTVYTGTLDHLTPATAADYLLSVASGTHGEARAAWRDGARVSEALEPQQAVRLPFFPGVADAYPYLSRESERLATALGLRELTWFNVFDGTHMLGALGRLQGNFGGDAELHAAATELARSAELDLFGRETYQLMVFQLEGDDGASAGLVLRAGTTYELTGATAAYAARMVLAHRIAPGAHYADEVLDPAEAVDVVASTPSLTLFERLERPLADELAVEEGVL
jgi:Saccharopine dehydrogenase NADP binding domain